MKLTPAQIRELARATASTRPQEIDCDEWLERVAAYLDVLREGRPVPPELADVAHHIEVCPDCRAELEVMLEMVSGLEDDPGNGASDRS
ncbi:MAG: zf-HC2 domain-containing protein [Planctomycetes bacterium]|nr:zf-HC2 domain-containing protein [Planctomycetota bacterium]